MKTLLKFLLRNDQKILALYNIATRSNTRELILFLVDWSTELIREDAKNNQELINKIEVAYQDASAQEARKNLTQEEIQRLVN
ncbi:hypothetical protein [Blackfly microvirus SF02]|uniref:Uncharacterized protein n=1 Tax=Blackfly microvirus SF02 TaxID=2576452 RepID=A0A4P8PTW3_9VIRU|nr:hypothetical protein [Blackfly microvirus SF02]